MKKKIISTAAIYFMAMGMFLCAFTQPAKETVLMTMAAIHGHPVADSLEGAKELPKEVQKAIDEHSLKNVWSYYVREETNSVEIRGYHGDEVDVVVPDRIDGMPVTEVIFGAFCYDCENITSVFIPESVVYIGSDVFLGSYKLTNIQVSSDNPVYASEGGILYDKEKTELICCPRGKQGKITDLPDSLESIKEYAFHYGKLTGVDLPESVKCIGDYAFEWCSHLESIKIPKNVSSIGTYAFSFCDNLADIELSEGLKQIEHSAFLGCAISEIKLPDSLECLEEWVFGSCDNLLNIQTSPENPNFESINGILYNKGKTQLVAYPPGKMEETVELPNSLTSIGVSAFLGNQNISYVAIPERVISIGEDAFCGCSSLVKIELPNGISSIGDGAFGGCENLTDVKLPKNLKILCGRIFSCCFSLDNVEIPEGVSRIEERAFYGCFKLSSIKLPESLERIEKSAFFDCTGLKAIEIPQGVEYIGGSVFSGCDHLTDIYYPGDKDTWDSQIEISDYCNKMLDSVNIHFNETMP